MYNNIHALIVDDEPLVLNLLNSQLSELKVASAERVTNGTQALNVIKENSRINLVFLDIQMPGKDGFDILKEIRQFTDDIVVIMLSGNSTIENVKKSVELGAKSFIAKPYTPKKIKHALELFEKIHQENNKSKK